MKSSSSLFFSTIVVAIAGFVSNAAVAQEVTTSPEITNFVSQKSRAEVRTERMQAIAGHRIARNDAEELHLAFDGNVSTKTRAEVVAETREAVRLGLIPRGEAEYSYFNPAVEQMRHFAQAGTYTRGSQVIGR